MRIQKYSKKCGGNFCFIYSRRGFFLFSFLLLFIVKTVVVADSKSPQREFRAVWIATVENTDWPSEKGLPVEKQKKELLQMLDTATALHLNAVILQVRPEGDAIYDSKLEPWSRYLSGTEGQPPDPYYDPLQFAVEECHKRCLEIHAWFNPYRASITQKTEHSSLHISNVHPDLVHPFGKLVWMEPGDPQVKQHTVDVIMDVVKRYDIDGVHFDDYFYPYDIAPKNPFPDNAVYRKYRARGGTLSLNDWRRDNINSMVQDVYDSIKKEKSWVKFGIAPFGIWQPGYPPGIVGLNSYNELYSDSRKWLQNGWVDYLTPQLYWKIAPPKQSYPKLLEWWLQQNTKGRHVYPGNNISNLGFRSKKAWPLSEIVDQVHVTREQGALGNIFFSMKVLMENPHRFRELLLKNCYPNPALVPAMPWLDKTIPKAPIDVSAQIIHQTKVQLKWTPAEDSTIWHWAVYKRTESTDWQLVSVLPLSQTSFQDDYSGTNKDERYHAMGISYAVTSLTRLANESPKTEIVIK